MLPTPYTPTLFRTHRTRIQGKVTQIIKGITEYREGLEDLEDLPAKQDFDGGTTEAALHLQEEISKKYIRVL